MGNRRREPSNFTAQETEAQGEGRTWLGSLSFHGRTQLSPSKADPVTGCKRRLILKGRDGSLPYLETRNPISRGKAFPSILGASYVLSCVKLFVTLWIVACQTPQFREFSRQGYWSGLPCPPLGDLPYPGIESASPVSPALQVDSLPAEPSGKLTVRTQG